MIIDLDKFIDRERPYWSELEELVEGFERNPDRQLSFEALQRFHYLYERATGGLGKLGTYSLRPETTDYLERLVAAAYSEVQDRNRLSKRFSFKTWFLQDWPRTVVRHRAALLWAFTVMMVGAVFGGFILSTDPSVKGEILPFSHLLGDPSDRVAAEEAAGGGDPVGGLQSTFSAHLMTHNIQVSIAALCLGVSWGIGTIVMLFYNGVILGAVAYDYVMAGEWVFLLGWLLPHGIVEIPAILIAGQGGLVLARAIVGWRNQYSLGVRLRLIRTDLITLIAGVGLMLIWAGGIEAFLSQAHEPRVPYVAKIAFGCVEGIVLFGFFAYFGRPKVEGEGAHE